MAVQPLKRATATSDQFPTALLDSLSEAIVVVDARGLIHYANLSAEQFFGVGRTRLVGHPLDEFVPEDTPLFSLLEQVLTTGGAVAENGVTLASPRIGNRFCALRLSPIVDSDGLVAVSLVEQTIARNIDRQMSHRSAARSVSALAAMLAHEVKNPLSGIRGAAQLLEQSVPDSERELTSLICEETDRIVALVDRMEAFADGRPIDRSPINIHQVLNHVLPHLAERLRQGRPLRRDLRSVAARRAWRPRPAHPGVPEPGEERLRGAGRRRARDRVVHSLPPRPAPGRPRPAGQGQPAPGGFGPRQWPRGV